MTISTSNGEYMSVGLTDDDKKVTVHVGYYEAELNNKQVDELILALKTTKKRAG